MSEKANARKNDDELPEQAEVQPIADTTPDEGPAGSPKLTIVNSDDDAEPSAGSAVKSARFAPLQQGPVGGEQGSVDLLFDVELDITVELGRTSLPVREVLHLGPGAVLELHKLAGEPVDVLANGRLIARGEVVVVDESFGVRVTELASQSERLGRIG